MRWLLLFVLAISLAAGAQEREINKGWEFTTVTKGKPGKWRSAEIPGTIHTDLMRHGLIPDPYVGTNEDSVQWVENEVWEYRARVSVTEQYRKGWELALRFDGLDTYADVFLNGKFLFHAENMFRSWEADVTNKLRPGQNELLVRFSPAAPLARTWKSTRPLYPDNERVFVRKAQYQFGWDWGPRLVTCGIWKPVYLVAKQYAPQPLEKSSGNAGLPVVRLHTEKDVLGNAFWFEINGKPVYMKGANWIPADNFLPRAKKRRYYEQQLVAAKEAGLNMLRVWGGGVYEDDRFYDLCDSLGIYVWQDFMFAGALYPLDILGKDNIEAEIREQVQRLRRHKCIVLWCGNNEIEEAWFNWGWQAEKKMTPADSARLWNEYRELFHGIIPRILKEEDPARPYWPSSPSLGWGRDSAYRKGDVHYWGVWWGKEPVSKYEQKVGRFNSEYGMQGMPDIRTIRSFAGNGALDTSLPALRVHQKHPFGYQNIKMYIEQKWPVPKGFDDLVYVSQLMQADAVGTAIDAHRRGEPFKGNMGTLFWQWNDCWPVTSWSAVDWNGRKKALYYEVKRAFAPIRIKAWIDPGPTLKNIFIGTTNLNGRYRLHTRHYSSELRITGDSDGPVVFDSTDQLQRVWESYWDFASPKDTASYTVLFRLEDSSGHTVAERVFFWAPPNKRTLQRPKFTVNVTRDYIEVTSDVPATGVELQVPDDTWLDDNFFDLFPGYPHRVPYRSSLPLEAFRKSLRIRSLADVIQP